MLVRLADWCYRRRRLVVVAWIVALVGSFALAGAFGGEPRQDYLQPGSESKAAADTLEAQFPQTAGDTVQVVVHSEDGVSSPDARAKAEKIFADVADSDHVVGVASPFTDERRGADLRGRHDGVRRGRPRPAGQRLHPGAGQGAGRTDPRRRRRHPPGRGRRPGRGALPDGPVRHGGHRPDRRRHHPAVHLRLRGGDGAAADHRGVRPRHRPGARRAPEPGRRRPGLGAADRRDGRPRRRHRLRAAHRHPVPQQPRRGAGAAARHR